MKKNLLLKWSLMAFVVFALLLPYGVVGAAPADGKYTVNYKVLKDGTESTSMMDNYTVKPANLTVTGGQAYVTLTLKSSTWITKFQTERNGQYVDADVISTNTAANTRVIGFPVPDLDAKLNAYTEVFIPALSYNGKYDVQLKFDTASITPVTP
ncbi:NEAT domain-containing protein [Paenibacillus sp. P96]|uniref:NEAT domain-containing protein n=1 Tax=Paenibacillus zeirhizosphaerae TaxID=2987519 RepID=A0ABT9FR31_9BACL|nr:NEAT domain-containing protein [Paenibacillus sp. P96]MDP4097172.1 NEAT domain-containing protein [Paenibacillus sp. P96]